MAKVVNKLDKVYLHDENGMYYRDHLGSKEAFITKLYPDNPNNLNPASGMITFSQTLTGGNVYDLEEAYVWLNFRLYNKTGGAVYDDRTAVAFSPDTFFNEVHVQINTVDINGGYAHLLKLIEYSPERAKMIQAREFFYPEIFR